MTELAFTPLRIGPVEAANRLALAPVKTALGGTDGRASARHVEYYRRRAAGGAGLLIVEPLYVDPLGREHPRQLGAHQDEVVPGLQQLTEAVHSCGSIVFAHINHAGRAANPKAIGGAPEAPSAVACPSTGAMPVAMTGDRIAQVLDAYGQAARRASEAGFDGIELQLGLGYLPSQFLSPRTNHRDDEYGNDRLRFVRELIEIVRRAAGASMALTVRLSADEKVGEGLALADAIELARSVEAWGVDGIHVVSGSACDSPPWYYQHMALPGGVNEALAAAVKKETSTPVLVAGRLGDPERIRQVLADGMADMVALGRPLVADPDLPLKMSSGREAEIMSCGSCLQGCLAEVKGGGPIGCIINPEVAHEGAEVPAAAADGGHLVVVGGGPAGMQAALTAGRHGYSVTMLERKPELGGLFNLAPVTPGKQAMGRPLQSLKGAVERAGIDVRTGVEATVEMIMELEPEHVILATGSQPIVPPIPGLDDPLTAEQVLTRQRQAGRRVLVLGGGLVGIELAEMLAAQGCQVVVVEMLADIARDMEPVTRKMTMRRLQELPVTIHTSSRLTRVEEGVAYVVTEGSDEETALGTFDSVLVAVGHRSFDPLSEALRAAGISVMVIGDADHPGQILDATRNGYSVLSRLGSQAVSA
jgi:2,4-dienoyl-CoA reductase-like NADH-dependent reductase (Old Yellow Enzyme family)/thioredoxin reductase